MVDGERDAGFWVLVAIGLLTAFCAALALLPAAGILAGGATATISQQQTTAHEATRSVVQGNTRGSPGNTRPETGGSASADTTTSAAPATSAVSETVPERKKASATPDEPAGWVMAVGDSAMLGAVEALGQQVPGLALVDAQGSRQMPAALDLLGQYQGSGHLTDVVVVHLGNNGLITAADFDRMMDTLEDASKVLVVNLTVPPGVADSVALPNNVVLADGVRRHADRAVLVDWRTAVEGHPEYFWDGVHLTPTGAVAYAGLIGSLLESPGGSAKPPGPKEAYYWGEGGFSGQCVGPSSWCRSVVRY